ncbi:MAG TPA: NAD-dependent deacylase [Anaerolineae bacterium]|nr:NAD-dependent deacylase [Anaerolineae bacterium]
MIDLPLVVLTGAGVSAESGVPTFRGPDGLWRSFRPEDLATPEAFARDPKLVWEWYAWRREVVAQCAPNAAHRTLVEIEAEAARAVSGSGHGNFTLITQNVDGLHEAAGSRNLLRLHGSLWSLRCTREGLRFEDRRVPLSQLPPVCPQCDALLRPDVVWFGERLDSQVLEAAWAAAAGAATLIVIGASAVVQPAASLALVAKQNGARLIEINPDETPLSAYADEILRGPAAIELPRWWKAHSVFDTSRR